MCAKPHIVRRDHSNGLNNVGLWVDLTLVVSSVEPDDLFFGEGQAHVAEALGEVVDVDATARAPIEKPDV